MAETIREVARIIQRVEEEPQKLHKREETRQLGQGVTPIFR